MTDLATRTEEQPRLDLGDREPPRGYEPDLAEIRQDLAVILASARAVTAEAPWDDRTLRYNRIIYPLLTRWLPDEEAARLCAEFAAEIERIEALAG
ncbi:MAG: hypothetical protein H7X93_08985 [Sphingomonadaceae bacterium]|nr:hypothetical protein [Sphingomonadaceae bacterium]